VSLRLPAGFDRPGRAVVLLGETADEFDGSAWAWVEHDHLGGHPPRVRLDAERALAALLSHLAAEQLAVSAHDLSEGGLAQALVEAVLVDGVGVTVELPGDPFVMLFSESSARVIVSAADARPVLDAAADHEVPAVVLGETGGESLIVHRQFEVALSELHAAFEGTLPALFG
jgi:phosphoribosylformylglycinamidine synthase